MALEPTDIAVYLSVLVAILGLAMAWLGYRSFRVTENFRLLFIVVGFVVFVLKSLFVAYNVKYHAVQHDSIELVSAMFDLVIVMLFFVPFIAARPRRDD